MYCMSLPMPVSTLFMVPTHHGKSWNLRQEFSGPGKSRKSHEIPPVGRGIF